MKKWVSGVRGYALSYPMKSAQVTGRFGLVQSALCGAPHKAEFGAAWKKTSNEGREYLSVKLDDPSFPAPIYATLVEGEDDTHTMIWSRRNGD